MITDQGYCSFCHAYRPLAESVKERHGYYCTECNRGLIYLVKDRWDFAVTQDAPNAMGRNAWGFDTPDEAREVLGVLETMIFAKGRKRAQHGRKS